MTQGLKQPSKRAIIIGTGIGYAGMASDSALNVFGTAMDDLRNI